MDSILQQFLSAQIINLDEDENYAKLSKAAADLTKALQKDKHKIQKAALVAFDANANPDDPLINEVKGLIIKQWNTFINKCQNQPISYIRAVMLEALQSVAKESDHAAIIWLTVNNYLPFYSAEIRERKLLEDFINACAFAYEKGGIQKWSNGSHTAETSIKLNQKDSREIKTKRIKQGWLVERLASSVGQQIGEEFNSQHIGTENYSGRAITVNQEWAKAFGKIAGESLESAINSIANFIDEELVQTATSSQVQAFFDEFNKQASAILTKIKDSSQSVDLRSQLLWLKESLYSTTLRAGYRKLDVSVSALVLAFETAALVPEYTPTSVEYFMMETLRTAQQRADEENPIENILSEVAKHKSSLHQLITKASNDPAGRRTLLSFMTELIGGSTQISDFETLVGVPASATATWAEVSVWVFRELQAQKFVNKK